MPSGRIPWLRIFVEGAVIIASVLLALAADAWWDGRQQRHEEVAILDGLRTDFRATLGVIDASRSDAAEVVAASDSLLALTGPGTPAVSSATVDTLLAAAIAGPQFDPVEATLTTLLNSDGLGVISNASLRRSLAQWSPRMERIRRGLEHSNSTFLEGFLPYLRGRIPIRAIDAIGQPFTGSQPSGFDHDSRELLSDLLFENGLNDILLYHSQLIAGLDDVQEHVEEILVLIDAELETS